VKTHSEDGGKVFVNICQISDVPAPEDINEETLLKIWSSDDHSSFRIPMSIGEGHEEADKGTVCCSSVVLLSPLSQCSSYVGFEVLTAMAMKSSVFRDTVPYSPLKSTDITQEQVLLAACFTLLSCLAYSSIADLEVTCSSKTLVDFRQTRSKRKTTP
jgi:hypothetical protein